MTGTFWGINCCRKNRVRNTLKTDSEFAAAFEKHKQLIEGINQQEQRAHLKQILATIHQQEFGKDAKIISIKEEETFIKKHGRTFAVAASVAVIAVLSTVAILKYWRLFTKTTK